MGVDGPCCGLCGVVFQAGARCRGAAFGFPFRRCFCSRGSEPRRSSVARGRRPGAAASFSFSFCSRKPSPRRSFCGGNKLGSLESRFMRCFDSTRKLLSVFWSISLWEGFVRRGFDVCRSLTSQQLRPRLKDLITFFNLRPKVTSLSHLKQLGCDPSSSN